MKKIKSIMSLGITLPIIILIVSCSENFLEVEPKGTTLEENYYSNEAEAYSGLVAVYDVLGKQSRGFENMIALLNSGSDDHFTGGGSSADGSQLQVFSNYTISESTVATSYWSDFYQGIFRANTLLTKLPSVDMSDASKARFTAETKALRAIYYFELVRLFKNIPLITSPLGTDEIYSVTQADPSDVYVQIETDLLEAISGLPVTLDLTNEAGRLTQGAAKALLGKVYLYQGKNSEAASQLAEVNGTPGATSPFGYKLLDNFSDLWVVGNNYHSESIIEIAHTDKSNADWGNWGWSNDEGNSLNVMVGPRGFVRTAGSTAPDYAAGWGFSIITQSLYDALLGDPRFNSTIEDIQALNDAGQVEYEESYQNTGYYLKKFMPLTSDVSTGGGASVLNYKQHTYMIRLADTYLLEAEALGGTGARAQALLDAVRARVGLSPTPVSIDAIINERRLELAGEGHRWYDLVRTGRAATVLADKGFTSGKNEILPIPLPELENTLLVQNPNY
ncbi:RagB/SusD family nutrient uptake outer membrane protein [Flaviramulus sp. BrNp1-15]|uniref:RagB/SusD family nutrient uptake outer membrane protein n=1 Tax=Flaviramulus sp. BrNp1-15 TaxID=2916754 RepID=UPI001EE9304C|nr:RagB/SusD family nutrient uptake outer membrane protein [Flaviramulus sp. BrNp1-15]ULC58012.1 RagB/SusD family nutrient uptake outer membrane protein [Flaviramulus sp. BrNp1-15]